MEESTHDREKDEVQVRVQYEKNLKEAHEVLEVRTAEVNRCFTSPNLRTVSINRFWIGSQYSRLVIHGIDTHIEEK